MAVVIETTLGDITVDLFITERPITCRNFLKLCKVKYYNFSLFHSVQSNFIAQTGDPTGTGNGGESVFGLVKGPQARYYSGEKIPKLHHDKPGLVSMVSCGDNMLGSQFFITLGNDLSSLDKHVIFGEVTEGFDLLLKLNEAICDNQNRPYQDIRITHTVILDDPFEDIEGLIIPDQSPKPSNEMFMNSRIGADEEIDETEGCTEIQIQELKAEQEAKAQATILEIVGDIPDKDIAPPENVLFVCKLNPVTTDEDLDIIFSRFGVVKSCEVIRDKVTGDSLQYAFIEFEDKNSCEEAYLKMDNVLIDDRRIHVDFSQSVAKLRWRGKGRGVEHLDEDGNKFEKGRSSKYKGREEKRDKHLSSYRKESSKSEPYRDKLHKNSTDHRTDRFYRRKEMDCEPDKKHYREENHNRQRHHISHKRDHDEYRQTNHRDKEKYSSDHNRKKHSSRHKH